VVQLVKALRYKPEVAGSVPNRTIGILHWPNPSGQTMALGSNQTLREMSTRGIFWGVQVADVGLTTLPPSSANCVEILEASTS